MDKTRPEPLTKEEFAALKRMGGYFPANAPPPIQIQQRLVLLGYAKEILGGLILTDAGLQKVAEGGK
jgi:hypothetical protein